MKIRTKLTNKESINQVILELTLDEKLNLVGEYTSSHSLDIPDMDIPSLFLADGATGINGTQMILSYITLPGLDTESLQQRFYKSTDFERILTMNLDEAENEYSNDEDMLGLIKYMRGVRTEGKQYVSFPSGINIGASFSIETAKKIAEATGLEFRDSGIDICLGPNVDIARDPLGGRNYEMYGEDPKLVADMSVAYIKGMQKTGVGACAKHFIANNQETNRNISNAYISERTIREIYAKGFESAVKKAGVKAIMTAYSSVNGKFSSYNKELLTNLLKKEWGFTGIVVSDWGAVKDNKEKSLEAGMDMILCGPNDMSECKKSIEDGRFSEEVLDSRVRAILNLIIELRDEQKKNILEYNHEKLLRSSYETIIDGSVLLKNNKILPLNRNEKISIYGLRSKDLIESGTGSTKVITSLNSNIWEECKKHSENMIYESMDGTNVLIYTVAAPAGENMDRDAMDIEANDRERLPEVLKEAKKRGLKTVVVLNIAGPVDMREWIDYADSILCIFIPGCMGGKATADILFGVEAPAGKLPITFPIRYEDTPVYPNFPSEYVNCYYGEEIFVGYRSYDKRKLAVQYPFGYGLSYTTFSCNIIQQTFKFDSINEEEIKIPIKVKNTGNRVGSEVVQIYGMEKKSRSLRPVKELFGFKKITLQPGEEKVVQVVIEKDVLRIYDVKKEEWIIPIGDYKLYFGTSSRDIFGEADLLVEGKNPYVLNGDSTIEEIIKNPKAIEIINSFTDGMFDKINEETLKFMIHLKLSDILSQGLITTIPDSTKVKEILTNLYEKLENLD